MSLSWLTLERYALGELDDQARRQVERALAEDAESRACLEQIEGDRRTLRPLPTLTTASAEAAPAGTGPTTAEPAKRRWSWRWLLVAGPALAAALLLLALWPKLTRDATTPPRPGVIRARLAIKGGELAIALVRDRSGAVIQDASSFRDGDRFKVLLTAPPPARDGAGLSAEVLVLQGGKVYLPLPRTTGFAGGNRKALQGAFRLDGSGPLDVCVIATASSRRPLPARSELRRWRDHERLQRSGHWVVCQRLHRTR